MKRAIILVIGIVVLLIGIGVFFFMRGDDVEVVPVDNTPTSTSTSTDQVAEEDEKETVIGKSVDGHDIKAYHYGEGDERVVFIGGVHGGYSWNTALLAYELMEELESNPDSIPENVKVTVIPVLNPDGLTLVAGTSSRFTLNDVDQKAADAIDGRFNGNNVDLNRNFDCDWAAQGTWQSRTVSGGSRAFSEPESQALRDFINNSDPAAVVVWYSAAGGVFASSCHTDVLTDTKELTKIFADASGYRPYEEFDFYEITGDMVNWMAKEGIPAISVLLKTHDDIDWEENWKGIQAVLNFYSE